MPGIAWLFIVLALALIVGSLFILRDNANMTLSKEKMAKVKKRQAELEEEERRNGDDDW